LKPEAPVKGASGFFHLNPLILNFEKWE
jgi:hypothetical protein